MVVCRFFLAGNCKFGDNCKHDHPNNDKAGAKKNPFITPSKPADANLKADSKATRTSDLTIYRGLDSKSPCTYSLSKPQIQTDLTIERPQWILSAYSPHSEGPVQLFGGEIREKSFEEMRLRFYKLSSQNQRQQAIQEADQMNQMADAQMRTIVNELDAAVKYIIAGEDHHPNRTDIVNDRGRKLQPQGQPKNFLQAAQVPNPSNDLRRPPVPSFGQASSPRATMNIAPNPFSQNTRSVQAQRQNPFAPTSTSHLNPAGQPDGFPANSNSQSSQSNAITTNPFAQPATSSFPKSLGPPVTAAINPFSQQLATKPNPFAQQAPLGNAFGSSSPAVNPFAQQSAVSQNNQNGSVATPKSNLGQPAITNQTSNTQGGQRPPVTPDVPAPRIKTWKGLPVFYVEDAPCIKAPDNKWSKIWFPGGKPNFVNSPDPGDNVYDDEIKQRYKFLHQHGSFKDDVVPLVPPKRDWCNWEM